MQGFAQERFTQPGKQSQVLSQQVALLILVGPLPRLKVGTCTRWGLLHSLLHKALSETVYSQGKCKNSS